MNGERGNVWMCVMFCWAIGVMSWHTYDREIHTALSPLSSPSPTLSSPSPSPSLSPSLSPSPSPSPSPSSSAGVHRVFGGHSVRDPSPFPWVVRLILLCSENDQLEFCSGVAVQDTVVVTAAHCWRDCEERNTLTAKVLTGRNALFPLQVIDVIDRIPHPQFSYSTMDHDVAVLFLKEKIVGMGSYPSLAEEACGVRERVYVAGWGNIEKDSTSPASLLQIAPLLSLPTSSCSSLFLNYNSKTMVCAGGEEGVDTCMGDSGGPLFVMTDCCYFPSAQIVGITSFGGECGELFAGVYANVPSHYKWIVGVLSDFGHTLACTPSNTSHCHKCTPSPSPSSPSPPSPSPSSPFNITCTPSLDSYISTMPVYSLYQTMFVLTLFVVSLLFSAVILHRLYHSLKALRNGENALAPVPPPRRPRPPPRTSQSHV